MKNNSFHFCLGYLEFYLFWLQIFSYQFSLVVVKINLKFFFLLNEEWDMPIATANIHPMILSTFSLKIVKLITLTPTCRLKMLLCVAIGDCLACKGLNNLCKPHIMHKLEMIPKLHDLIMKELISQPMKYSHTTVLARFINKRRRWFFLSFDILGLIKQRMTSVVGKDKGRKTSWF